MVKKNIQFLKRTVPNLWKSEVAPDKQYNASASPNESENEELVTAQLN